MINTKDFYRDFQRVSVTAWHWAELQRLGFVRVEQAQVPTPSYTRGTNRELRVEYEDVAWFKKD